MNYLRKYDRIARFDTTMKTSVKPIRVESRWKKQQEKGRRAAPLLALGERGVTDAA
jgi:hypothetical protein